MTAVLGNESLINRHDNVSSAFRWEAVMDKHTHTHIESGLNEIEMLREINLMVEFSKNLCVLRYISVKAIKKV